METPSVGEIDTHPKICGHCGTNTVFTVLAIDIETETEDKYGTTTVETLRLLKCKICSKPVLEETIEFSEDWGSDPNYVPPVYILYPIASYTPKPTKDMPKDLIEVFNEARDIFNRSPRASAALLRLLLQKLCIHLGQPGKNINDDIAALVKNGLPSKIQQSLDIVRVIGNNAVHPGEIDLNDNADTVLALFGIINFIVEEMITRPREINKIYSMLPENTRKGIEARDKHQKSTAP